MENKRPAWSKDPAFWVVLISFAVFVATAIAVFRSSPKNWGLSPKLGTVPNFSGAGEESQAPVKARRVSIDARSTTKWVHFNLSQGRIVHPRFVSSQDWDLAFRRYHVIANGGSTNLAADGAILDLGSVDFRALSSPRKRGSMLKMPAEKFVLNTKAPNGREPENLAIRHWYSYDYASHILTPLPHVYLVRTPYHHAFAFRILDYYCRNGQSGCLTFEYYKVGKN